MIVIEDYKTRADGVKLVRTYSDAGFRLLRSDGTLYDEAIDVEGSEYTYVESEELVDISAPEEPPVEELPEEPPIVEPPEDPPNEEVPEDEELTAEEALAIILGEGAAQ